MFWCVLTVAAVEEVRGRNLVFTSAGDHSIVLQNWIGDDANYDVFLVYYGDDDAVAESYEQHCRWVRRRRGSKPQNFFQVLFIEHRSIFDSADYVLSLDDDIVFDEPVAGLNLMFAIARQYRLEQASPALAPTGRSTKFTFDWNETTPDLVLRYVSLVEHNSVIASREAWEAIMAKYHPSIISYGMPHLATCALGLDKRGSYAVIFKVKAFNPPLHSSGVREIKLSADKANYTHRAKTFRDYATSIGCPTSVPSVHYSALYEERLTHSHPHRRCAGATSNR